MNERTNFLTVKLQGDLKKRGDMKRERKDTEEFTRVRQRLAEARADPHSPRSAALTGGSRWCNVPRQWNQMALRNRQLRQASPEDSRTKSSAGQTHPAADSRSGPMRVPNTSPSPLRAVPTIPVHH